MKKIYIIVAAIILVLVVTVILLAVFGGSKKITPDDPDSKYAYYYQKDGKNITVTVEGEFPEGYAWYAEDSGSASAAATTVSSGKNKAEFSVSPVKEGRYSLVLALKKDGFIEDRIYEIWLNFAVDSGNNIELSSSSHRELAGAETFSDEGYEYVAASSGNGINICVRNKKSGTFEVVIDNRIVSVAEVTFTDEGVTDSVFEVTPINVGNCVVYLVEAESGKAIKLGLSVDAEGNISVDTHGVIEYDRQKVIDDEDFKTAESIVGKITLPENSERTGCSINGYSNSKGKSFVGIAIKVFLDENTFDYVIFPETELSVIDVYYTDTDTAKSKVNISGLDAVLYVSTYYNTIVWTEKNNVFSLTSSVLTGEELTDAAEEFTDCVGN